MFAVMKEHPWMKRYWYIGLGVVFVLAIGLVLYDGYTQVNKSKRRALRRAQKQQAMLARPQSAEEGEGATHRRISPPSSTTTADADAPTRQRRTRKAD